MTGMMTASGGQVVYVTKAAPPVVDEDDCVVSVWTGGGAVANESEVDDAEGKDSEVEGAEGAEGKDSEVGGADGNDSEVVGAGGKVNVCPSVVRVTGSGPSGTLKVSVPIIIIPELDMTDKLFASVVSELRGEAGTVKVCPLVARVVNEGTVEGIVELSPPAASLELGAGAELSSDVTDLVELSVDESWTVRLLPDEGFPDGTAVRWAPDVGMDVAPPEDVVEAGGSKLDVSPRVVTVVEEESIGNDTVLLTPPTTVLVSVAVPSFPDTVSAVLAVFGKVVDAPATDFVVDVFPEVSVPRSVLCNPDAVGPVRCVSVPRPAGEVSLTVEPWPWVWLDRIVEGRPWVLVQVWTTVDVIY